MKGRYALRLVVLVMLVLGSLGSGVAIGEECDGQYFSPQDYKNEFPLQRPAKEFLATLRGARAGVAVEQRNLAVSYETGYLVSKCQETAIYWYGQAAASGDDVAKKWISRHKMFAALRKGPECVGDQCLGPEADESRVAVLYSNANRSNHFFAPVTINGRSAEGMIDTGATTIAMSVEMAKSFGINFLEGDVGRASTANGKISIIRIVVPLVDVAGIKLRNVPVSVGITGEMLIGMSFLSRVNVTMAPGVLTMTKQN